MSINLTTQFMFDRVVWICCLDNVDTGPTGRILEDLETICSSNNTKLVVYHARSAFEFAGYLDAERIFGGSPLIHIDAHGDENLGVKISITNEYISHFMLTGLLREINKNSGNNLMVVSGCCFGLHATKSTEVLKSAPFFMYLGPEELVTVGELEGGVCEFYSEIVISGRVGTAIEFLPSLKIFHAQKLLFGALIRYLANHSTGKGAKDRFEDLVSQAKAKGILLLNDPVGPTRSQIKNSIREQVSQEFVDQISNIFLIGRPSGFSIDDLLTEIELSRKSR